ncbi:MAG: hypothetical protein R3B96_03780 [Pirellulaceae bacterium]
MTTDDDDEAWLIVAGCQRWCWRWRVRKRTEGQELPLERIAFDRVRQDRPQPI